MICSCPRYARALETLLNFKTDTEYAIKFQAGKREAEREREREREKEETHAISRDKNDFIKIQQVDRKFRSEGGVTLNVVT